MKRTQFQTFLFLSILIAATCSSFMDYPDNPPNGYTGSSAANCANCHGGGNFGGTVAILGVPSSIAPSTTYSITVTSAKTLGSTKKAGFQLNVLNGAGSASGTLSTSSANVRIESGFAEHLETSTFQNFVSSSGIAAKTWTFNWTSPASSANSTINFYVCSVIGNGASGTSGDQVVLNTASGTFGAPLTVTQLAKTNVSCAGGNNGTATVNASGGSGCSYTYSWSNGQNSQVATGLSAGVYTVTATCGASSATTSVTITEPASALNVTTTGSTLICQGNTNGTASVSASGGGTSYAYLWSNNQTTASISNLSAGTYNVTVTDNNGCTSIKSALVANPTNSVTASASATIATCITEGTATATASNGTAPYTYLWSNGQSDATAINLAPNTYQVTVTDNNGCKASTSTTVSSNKTAPPSTISGNSALTCVQSMTSLSGPAGNYSYLWSTTETGSSINVISANTYILTVTDKGNGCTSSSSKTVTNNTSAPTVSISGNNNINCSQPSTILTASGANSYQWSGPGILFGNSSATATINTAGTYTVTATNSSNGCTNTATVNITDNFESPIIPNITPLNANISCASTFVTLTSSASDALLHQWKFNGNQVGTGRVFNAVNPGTYTLILTNLNNGCTVQTNKVVTTSTVVLSVAASGGKLTCSNTNLALSATAAGAVSYTWSGPGFTSGLQSPNVSNPGTYTVVASDVNGCTGTAQAIVSSDTQKPLVTASASGSISCSTASVTLSASSVTPNLNYSWSSNTGFSNSGNPVVTQQSGDYTVTATNPTNGCTSTASVQVNSSNDKPILSTSSGTITCKDSIVDIAVLVTGNTTGLTYKWSGPLSFTSTKSTEKVTVPGDYNLTVTASNGCSSIAVVAVKIDNSVPSISIQSSKEFICNNDTLVLSAQSTTSIQSYNWSDKSNDAAIKVNKAGTYKVSVTAANGCSDSAELQIKDGKSPEISIVADSLTCLVSKIKPSATIIWDTPLLPNWVGPSGFKSSILQPEITKSGTYTLTVSPKDGCPASKSITIKENKITPTIKITGNTFTCDSTPIVLVANSTVNNLLWKGFGINNITNPTVLAAKTGRYYSFTAGTNGCVAVDSIDVIVQNPPFAIDSAKSMVVNTTGTNANGSIVPLIRGAENKFSYKWSNGADTRNLNNLDSGNYCLTVTDANGCSARSCFTVKTTVSTIDVGIEDLILIKPNPVLDILHLERKGEFTCRSLKILSDKGEQILQYDYAPEQIDFSLMPSGIYFLKIEIESEAYFIKKVIKR
ncbi:MAG: choice-of-anchor V domain-containing protein [Saprospiraceae bacterium]